jgi:hypothetical protein
MQVRRSLAIGLTAASLALAAIGGVSASAAAPQNPTIPSESRDIVFTTAHVSDLETILPTGLQNTLPAVADGPVSGPDARS